MCTLQHHTQTGSCFVADNTCGFLTEDEDLMKYLPDSAGDLGSGTKTKNHYNTVHSCRSLLRVS